MNKIISFSGLSRTQLLLWATSWLGWCMVEAALGSSWVIGVLYITCMGPISWVLLSQEGPAVVPDTAPDWLVRWLCGGGSNEGSS